MHSKLKCKKFNIFYIISVLHFQELPDSLTMDAHQFTISGMNGRYEESCGGVNKYNVVGIGYSRTEKFSGFNRFTYGARGYLGSDQAVSGSGGFSKSIRGINPFILYDRRWIGIGAGFHAGQLVFDNDRTEAFPQFSLRLGPYDRFFIESKVGDHYPGPSPGGFFKLGIGFSNQKGSTFRVGVADPGIYASLYRPITDNLYLHSFVAAWEVEKFYQLNLGLHYLLPK